MSPPEISSPLGRDSGAGRPPVGQAERGQSPVAQPPIGQPASQPVMGQGNTLLGAHLTVSSPRARAYEKVLSELLAVADVRLDGSRPWDIRVNDERLFQRVL